MLAIIRFFATWPFLRIRDALHHRRFERLVRSATHDSLLVDNRGIELLPGSSEIPWPAIDEASWTHRTILRAFAQDGGEVVVTFRLKDGTARVVVSNVEGPAWSAVQQLLARGVLPKDPVDAGIAPHAFGFVIDAVWLAVVALLAWAIKYGPAWWRDL